MLNHREELELEELESIVAPRNKTLWFVGGLLAVGGACLGFGC